MMFMNEYVHKHRAWEKIQLELNIETDQKCYELNTPP